MQAGFLNIKLSYLNLRYENSSFFDSEKDFDKTTKKEIQENDLLKKQIR